MSDRLQRLHGARLYLVCDDQPDAFLDAVLRGGVDVVQLRCKEATDDRVARAARRFAMACARHGALFILNDRPDLAAGAGADGVHVGQDDVSVEQARALLGPGRLVGLSTHSAEQIDGKSADYIGVGPVYPTPTKPGAAAVGLELVRYASEHAQVPFFAIGGIGPENVGAVRAAGAQRIAVLRALTQAENPEHVARELRSALAVAGRQPVGSA